MDLDAALARQLQVTHPITGYQEPELVQHVSCHSV